MDLITKFLELHNQLKVYHWQTDSYAQHKAFGETYEELGDLIDSFMEEIMGKYGRFQLSSNSIQVINMSELDLPDFIDGAADFQGTGFDCGCDCTN